MYDMIVLGATFAAAGIAQKYGKHCLVIEDGTRAGFEFFGALHFGKKSSGDLSRESLVLQEKLYGSADGVYGSERHIYPLLEGANVVFGAMVASVEKTGDHFSCRVLGVSGYLTYEAKQIVDTRCAEAFCGGKTYNLLIESKDTPAFPGVACEQIAGREHYVLFCAVPLSCSYPEAHQIAFQVMQQFSDGQRLILSADKFDYQVRSDYPKKRKGILHLPSKAYDTPVLAFEAGLRIREVL